ncbi:response regulator containing a CheY-like receiver domain and a GGDEF domain [Rivularia sp. PCC 7116]|uniref:response regulator n=1 Tax=Rivularia sp. PCC 7116 TaxID=373994 RepID=UPI00029F2C5B|nr:response regulator [Rivularia sp. PCC 7116]AFY53547.1 response regulator containing a CheY-like receiver domain and a GGDEF domain [Rivularia sp. PCC 7116]
MVHTEFVAYKDLIEKFKTCTTNQYSGKLEINSSKNKWSLYYRFGRIIWATGGIHQFRRWRRKINQYCPQIKIDEIKLQPIQLENELWDYQLLVLLYKRKKADRKQVEAVAKNIISEVLFDIAQQANFEDVTCVSNPKVILDISLTFMNTEFFLNRMEGEWNAWSSAGLANFTPHLSPALLQPKQVQQLVTPTVYQNFVNFINGEYTLQDLALKLDFNILKISSDLLPFILRGFIKMSNLPDLPLAVEEVKNYIPSSCKEKLDTPLIACIDDSLQICQTLESIITANNMRFVQIQDAIQALPTLIENKPDVILLDLMMPVVNGYEVCAQIRRVNQLANVPVIILTGSDGLFDKFRAKVAGSTDFMSKPIVAEKLLAMIKKYLNNKADSLQQQSCSNTGHKTQFAI